MRVHASYSPSTGEGSDGLSEEVGASLSLVESARSSISVSVNPSGWSESSGELGGGVGKRLVAATISSYVSSMCCVRSWLVD